MLSRLRRLLLCLGALCALAASAGAAEIQVTTLATGTTDVALVEGAAADARLQLLFCGFSAMETVGSSSSTVRVYAGTSAAGRLLFSFSLTASESRSEGPWTVGACLPASEGIFIDRGGSGSTLVSVYSLMEVPGVRR
jgi:hypothetical protein